MYYMIGNSAVPYVKSNFVRSSSNDSPELIGHAVKRARRLSGLILRSFASRDTAFFKQIFKLYIKPFTNVRFPIKVALAKTSTC